MKRATPQSWLLHSCGRAVGRAWNRQPAWGPSSSPDCRRREGNQLSQQWASLLKSGVKGCSVVVTVQNARAALRVNHIWNIDCKNCMIQLIYLNFFSILDNSLVSGGKSQIISKVARFFFHWLSSFSQNVPSWTKMLWTIHDPTWSKNHYTK